MQKLVPFSTVAGLCAVVAGPDGHLREGNFYLVRVFWRRVNFAEDFVAIVLDEQHFIFSRWSVYHHVRKEMFTCASKILHGLFEPHERCPSFGRCSAGFWWQGPNSELVPAAL